MLITELGEKHGETLGSLKGECRMDLLSVSALQALLNLHGNVKAGIMISFITVGCHTVQ